MNTIDTLYFHLTQACNLHCIYCYFFAGKPMQNELSTEEISTIFKSLTRLKPIRVVFTGGEPLLRQDLLLLSFKFYEFLPNVTLCIATNGTLITKENAKEITHSFDEIIISIDGSKEINNICRGDLTFERSLRAFRYILDAGGDPVASITVTKYNYLNIKDFMHYLIKIGIYKIHISPLISMGRAQNLNISCNHVDLEKKVDEFWNELFGLNIEIEDSKEINCGVGKYLTIYPTSASISPGRSTISTSRPSKSLT